MADTRDLKSLVKYLTCGFESRSWHHFNQFTPCVDFCLCLDSAIKC